MAMAVRNSLPGIYSIISAKGNTLFYAPLQVNGQLRSTTNLVLCSASQHRSSWSTKSLVRCHCENSSSSGTVWGYEKGDVPHWMCIKRSWASCYGGDGHAVESFSCHSLRGETKKWRGYCNRDHFNLESNFNNIVMRSSWGLIKSLNPMLPPPNNKMLKAFHLCSVTEKLSKIKVFLMVTCFNSNSFCESSKEGKVSVLKSSWNRAAIISF